MWLNLPTHPLLHLITGVQLPSPQLQLHASGVPCPFWCYSSHPSCTQCAASVGLCGESSPSLLQLPARRRQTCCSSWQTAQSAAAEEGCSAKPRRSKTGKVHNKATRLLWGFCQKVAIKLPSSCGYRHRFTRETAGRGRVLFKKNGHTGKDLVFVQKPWSTS